ncbi:MAG: HAD family hydrolase [Candidatus Dojkabacteria bacterium]
MISFVYFDVFGVLIERTGSSRESFEVIEGVVETLERFSKVCKLGIISNMSHRETLEEFKKKLGLWEYFEVALVSCETGIRKPEPEVFELAITRADVHPSEILFIDDSVENLQAARKAGFGRLVLVEGRSVSNDFKVVKGIKDIRLY